MSLRTLQDLYVQQLEELYNGEKHSLQVMPRLAGAAADPDLAVAFDDDVAMTRSHVQSLEVIFDQMNIVPQTRESEGLEGLLGDCLEATADDQADSHVRDAALIAVAQHVKHDEIAGYGCARAWAQTLGNAHARESLGTMLDEEKDLDLRLTNIAENLNFQASIVS